MYEYGGYHALAVPESRKLGIIESPEIRKLLSLRGGSGCHLSEQRQPPWSVGAVVSTRGFHPLDMGSIPVQTKHL